EETKSFSQDEVNTLLKKEKEKYSKKMPDEKTYKAFRKWQENQKTDAQINCIILHIGCLNLGEGTRSPLALASQ
ncbi:MAG TPA: hypothetical protein PK230_13080, partial [Chitinophagales bacterium]|nr:hypothetical protein [Chitinophagales bacterium]